ncbi:hypothetical protein PF005_g1188 [Phytophthora fragariae]|uniref:EF-hand domain-containing protein n=1 Tax=Phytophthora fragariae TaxID=53985 RepID=A0A6A4EWS5_9STRA|nr:hypothetical protein PF011_g951 [Phytophthora fragariae]KAE9138233.1 hypothetical protein PF007_g1493 [Phytophthora fragariae]KAE9154753.1 hypothetical protein PF006_g1234 [Phytophthora fragariae]KAE9236083.1 hypothetical protein PF005_g1188 [Phytophthora fragariae]KAE9256612.1 hypothetical protein PF002_g1793 [Phytophthora fragariae]
MGSLDDNYALLSDVSARNRALQARLRGSLPLLWTDNALVMTSAAPRRRRGGLHPFEPSGADGEADQMFSALEGQASLQVSRRYKRRVEWEVTRRIARVDRELQQYPPAQRFWNQKRREETPPRPSLYRQRAERVETGGRVDVFGQKNSNVKTTRVARVRRDSSDKAAANLRKSKLSASPMSLVKPRVLTESSSNEKKRVKHVATSPLAIERDHAEDKENVTSNAVTPVTFETSGITMKEQLRGDFGSNESVDSKRLDGFYTGEVEEVKEEGKHDDELKTYVVSSEPAEAQNDTFLQGRNSTAEDFVIKPRKDALASVYQSSDADVASVIDDTSPRRTKPHVEDRPSSSIGRQVLSDFRTMPSVASFGARPILPADGFGKTANTRLNADVLRRLFSDLDTDKDGHVNRIETCMALHRLQISVSTAKIISFFRHIHSSTEGNAVRSRNTQHLPMHEVINYKEFVAFVTAAFDKQQQRKSRRSGSQMRRDKAIPFSVPSTSLPIYSHRTSPPKPKSAVRAYAPATREHEIRAYEMNDADPEQDVASLEERVIKEIPDLLISRMMAGTTNKAANEAATSIVRRSLESLVGKESVDDQTVKEITQELLRERLRNVEGFNQNDDGDVTGLKRAAAYYNQQMVHSDIESSSVADGSGSEDLTNWVDILTEEQVSGLVQQIWKDKQASVHHAAVGAVEEENIENPSTDIPDDQTVKWIDEATDTSELNISGVAILEKTVQASDDNYQGESTTSSETANMVVPVENRGEDAVSSTATISRPYLPQIQFARALVEPNNDSQELFSSVTSIQLLQQLRQQSRMHQNMPPDDGVVKFSHEPNGPNRGGETNAIRMDFLMEDNLFSSEDDCESASSQSDIIDQSHQHNHERNVSPLPTTETALLTEKFLDVDESVSKVSSHEQVLRGSISASSSGLSSASESYYLHGMHQEIDHLHLSTRTPRRHHRRRRKALSVSGSSVPDSLCSAELSEGELSREEALELSDGEIFGECKRNYIKCKNATRGAMKSPDGEDNLHSSIESGELPFTSVTSSVESGEIEDGTVPG